MKALIVGLLFLALPALAVIEPMAFDTPAEEARYQYFIDVLRCPKCQNQNLSGSDAPIAKDLRRHLHRLIMSGASDAEIREWMVQRYGNFVLYETPVQPRTWLLWFGPVAILAIGLLAGWRIVRGARVSDSEADSELTEQQKQRLKAVLGNSDD